MWMALFVAWSEYLGLHSLTRWLWYRWRPTLQ
jgi:hypothetical protein